MNEKNNILSNKYQNLILEDKEGNVILKITPDTLYVGDEEHMLYLDEYTDEMIECVDCGNAFPFTDNERNWYEEKGFSKPKRCSSCREARKQQ